MLLNELALKHNTDKSSRFHNYTKWYDRYLSDKRLSIKSLLEIGVETGASLRMWKEYLPSARIVGIDRNPDCTQHFEERIDIGIYDQVDPAGADWAKSITDKYDVIIDDGHHTSSTEIGSFNIYWPLIKSGGLYVIEDLHCNFLQNDLNGFVQFLFDRFVNINLDGLSNMGSYELSSNNLCRNGILSQLAKEIEFIHMYQHIIFFGKR